jgi:hypothetical protein
VDTETLVWTIAGLALVIVTWRAIRRNERDGTRSDEWGNSAAWDAHDSNDSGGND